jgi:hypothetical protein
MVDQSMKDYYNKQFIGNRELLRSIQNRNEKFLNYTDVAPTQLITEELRRKQAVEIERFTDEMRTMAKQPKTMSNLMKAQSLQKNLLVQQQNWKANEALYLEARDKMQKQPWMYKTDPWKKEEENLFVYGVFNPEAALKLNAPSIKKIIADIPDMIGIPVSSVKNTTLSEDGKVQSEAYVKTYVKDVVQPDGGIKKVPLTNDELRTEIGNAILKDPQFQWVAKQNFEELSEAEQKRYLDEEEKTGKNAIIAAVLDQSPAITSIPQQTATRKELRDNKLDIDFIFGVNGQSKDKKGTFEYINNITTERIEGGEGITFTGEHKIRLPSDIFDFPEGYPQNISKYINIIPTGINKKGEFEGSVDLQEPVYGEKWVSADEYVSDKDLIREATPEDVQKNIAKEGDQLIKYKLPQKGVVVITDLAKIQDKLKADYVTEQLDAVLKKLGTSKKPKLF